jgi:uncharacterized protein
LTTAVVWTVLTAGTVAALVAWTPWWVAATGGVAVAGFGLWRVLRQRRLAQSWGYAERANDLYITHGLWFKNLTVVPYGRMQVVEVTSGPIERRFGLATVELVTASAHTNATIPGLTAVQAAALRDRLSERGEHQATGL